MFGDFINKIMQVLRNLFEDTGSPDEPLDPMELKRMLLEEAQDKAKHWDDQLDLPNAFDVYMSQREWDGYYGARSSQTESRLEDALARFAEECGATMESPKVTLLVDEGIQGGEVSIDAFFTEPSGEGVTPIITDFGKERGDGGEGASWSTTPVYDASQSAFVDASSTPQFQPENTASVILCEGGRRFDVRDGDTIGVLRDPSREVPSIHLPYSQSLYYCSQVQGEFRNVGDAWSIADKGRNTTRVKRGDEWLQPVGETYALEDGDAIFFGPSDTPAVTFRSN
jgi:hypothetical protein